jgi:hypothetical protein
MASTAGIAPATSTFARWRSDLTELRGLPKCTMENAKCRVADQLCMHRSLILNSEFCTLHLKMVPEVGIAPTSPALQAGANLPQLLGVMARRAEAQRAKAGRPGR